jgi:death-on-curing protein
LTEPEFLLRDVVEYLHDQAVRTYGGHFGIRDDEMLESALARPREKWTYGDPPPDMADLATAYAFGIGRNHAFIDGNRRTGWAAAVLFLRANGVSIGPSGAETLANMARLAEGLLSEAAFATWLRSRIQPRP